MATTAVDIKKDKDVPVLVISDILVSGKHTAAGTIIIVKESEGRYLAACNKVKLGERRDLEEDAKAFRPAKAAQNH